MNNVENDNNEILLDSNTVKMYDKQLYLNIL